MRAGPWIIAFLAGLAYGAPAEAQLNVGSVALEIRKSFDGAKSETEPALFSVIDTAAEGAKPTWLIDLGIRTTPMALVDRTNVTLSAFPTFEWHRAEAEGLRQVKAIHKVQAGAQAELLWSDVSPTNNDPARSIHALQLIAKADYSRNVLKSQNEGSFSLLASIYGERGTKDGKFLPHAWPGGVIKTPGRRIARYFPYVGIEQHLKLAIGDTPIAPAVKAWTGLFRLRVELFPVDSPDGLGRVPVVVSGEVAKRALLNDVAELDGVPLTYWMASVNWYLDAERHVGLGYTLESGRLPLTNFSFQRRSAVALKIKY